MASYNKKTGVITEKIVGSKKYAIVFASTQSRIIRLRKYPIDPKAYLGRWMMIFFCFKFCLTGLRSAVGNMSGYRCVSDCRSRGREFDPGPVQYFRGD